MHPKVKEYLDKQVSPQKEILLELREILLRTFPNIEEDFKNGVPWYENMYYLAGLRDHVNMGFAIAGLSDEDLALFEGQGALMRHRKFYELDDIDEKHIVKLLHIVREEALA